MTGCSTAVLHLLAPTWQGIDVQQENGIRNETIKLQNACGKRGSPCSRSHQRGAALSRSVRVDCRVGLSVPEQLIKRNIDVFGNLTKQDWRDVPPLMKGDRCTATCGIAKLFVRPSLANFGEAESEKNGYDFTGFEDGNIAHGSSNGDVLNSNELGLQRGFAVFEKHCNNVVQVVIDFVQRFPLGMRAGKTGNETNEQASLWAPLNYR